MAPRRHGGGRGFHTLRVRWLVDVHRRWLGFCLRLPVGLAAVPLPPLGVGRRVLGLGPRLLLGAAIMPPRGSSTGTGGLPRRRTSRGLTFARICSATPPRGCA